MKTALFLCTGNYYRSRFAEEIFNAYAPRDWRAFSRGIAVDRGCGNIGPISRSTAQALRERGIPFDRDKARPPLQLTVEDLDGADHIVALKMEEHMPLIRRRFSAWAKTAPPGRIMYWHIDDIDIVPPETALPLIELHVRDLIGRLS